MFQNGSDTVIKILYFLILRVPLQWLAIRRKFTATGLVSMADYFVIFYIICVKDVYNNFVKEVDNHSGNSILFG